jgi:hypothetical protein
VVFDTGKDAVLQYLSIKKKRVMCGLVPFTDNDLVGGDYMYSNFRN